MCNTPARPLADRTATLRRKLGLRFQSVVWCDTFVHVPLGCGPETES